MIDMHKFKAQVEAYSWYQTINFGAGLVSKGCEWCGDPAWGNIKKFLPDNLDGKRVLDLGCNAGIFSVRSAMMGAKEVIGIDCNNWKKDVDYLEQAGFVKNYFEHVVHRDLPIKYIKGRMEEVLNDPSLGKFDYCFAIACLYYTTEPEMVVKRLGKICKNLIVRIRDENRISMFTDLFKKHGFELIDSVQEDWETKLGFPADDFYLYHYDTLL